MIIDWVEDIGTKVGVINSTPRKTVFEDSKGVWRILGETTKEQDDWHGWLRSGGYDHGEELVKCKVR